MNQTLLALAAILVFSVFALNQHRAQASVERTAMSGELELAATEIARARLVEATALAFDEALAGSDGFEVALDALTLPGNFGPDVDGEAVADDVDDLDGVVVADSTLRNGQADRAMRFTVTYAVRYVQENAPGMAANPGERTLAKEVSVTVQEADAGAGRPPVRCTLSQVVTPVWRLLHG